ncbi:hypothetical protein [Rhodopila sp.]|uniref:hypothetical protein n=1 Tax=Rhodopila sp. TaxID=2480087 RepID=UPI003D0F98C4
MKATPGARLTGVNGQSYTADKDGLIANVEQRDIPALREQGAGFASVSPFKHLKLLVSHALYFEGKTHKADGNNILRNVPRDHAEPLIESGAAREATEAELAPAVEVAPIPEPIPVIEPDPEPSDVEPATAQVAEQPAEPARSILTPKKK